MTDTSTLGKIAREAYGRASRASLAWGAAADAVRNVTLEEAARVAGVEGWRLAQPSVGNAIADALRALKSDKAS